MDEQKFYLSTNYREAKEIIREKLKSMSRTFIAAGFYLRLIRDTEGYKEDGYKDIWEFAEDQYGIKRSTTSRWMAMNEKFSDGGNSPFLAEEFSGFGKSQLQEMLYLDDKQIEEATPQMTVKEIRELREPERAEEEPVSTLGYPLRVYPEGSLIATPGCGKQDCFSCHRGGCEIRQVDCYCVEAPMGNPFPCTTLNVVENLRQDIGNRCQFVNEDLAFHRAGDGQPVPCCKKCNNPCGYECNRSVQARHEVAKEKMCDVAQTGTCIHRPEFACTLPEASKLAVGDGVDCSKKCCWDCPKRMECGYRCNSAAGHPIEEQIPGQMNVEDHPELLPDRSNPNNNIDNDEDDVVDEQYETVIDAEYQELHEENLDDDITEAVIRDYLSKAEKELADYIRCNEREGNFPHNLLRRQRILVMALRLLLKHESNQDEREEDDELEAPATDQPELPVLKNNDQRKEWLEDYKAWGIWYRDENIDVNYYKYDFPDGSRLVVEEYPQRRMYWKAEELADEHYYHLIEKNKKFYGSKKTFEGKYENSTDSETRLVEFLKNLQKGEKSNVSGKTS